MKDDFDWVTARVGCSIGAIFERLRVLVEADVETRNAALGAEPMYKFEFSKGDSSRFAVLVTGRKTHGAVHFQLKGDRILISETNHTTKVTEVRATLSDDGECRAKVGSREFDLWQLRKLALEEFFFRD